MAQLQLGTFVFEMDDLPDEITLGGDQMLSVIQYPGGNKEVQSFGPQDRNPSWSGVFNYANAITKVRALDSMYRSGNVFPLKIDRLSTRYCVIRKFEWIYRSSIEIPYEIELEIAPQQSVLLQSSPLSGSDNDPSSDTPPPQSYLVMSGDSIWSIALQFYGDGSQYRKILQANNITDPNGLTVGQKLVIPA